MNSIINVPTDTVVAGLRQRRDELAEQLARLDRTRQTVESDLESLEQAIQVVGGQRTRTTMPLPVAGAATPVAPAPARGDAVGRRGDLPAAVRRALLEYGGALTTAEIAEEIRGHIPPELTTEKKVSLCLGTMAVRGMVSGTAVVGSRCKQWSLTDRGHEIATNEGGAA
ncbi:hypothetical protein [Roseomonas genomospecies 6]|uniref:Uncharacterized protein n=1 Tax=Roseomonas genomospecies 6 TaxID=214106 RepID=A0A9W7NLB8_9PROT|nr:hypothetical protein [Roseomonas genomospecies 6]KAA0682202.1 hypothetical protein DS843_06560 [Roseomonas genomospecies 6]